MKNLLTYFIETGAPGAQSNLTPLSFVLITLAVFVLCFLLASVTTVKTKKS